MTELEAAVEAIHASMLRHDSPNVVVRRADLAVLLSAIESLEEEVATLEFRLANGAPRDSCEAVFVGNLEPEWLQALEAADYSHLSPKGEE
jgi:hypothetical protein